MVPPPPPEPAVALRQIVTVSATYGSGGSVVARQLATYLGVPFYDRLLHGPETRTPDAVVERLTDEERRSVPPGRVVTGLAHAGASLGLPLPPLEHLQPHAQIRQKADESLERIDETGQAVVLGRAAAVVLRGRPNVFHVRLDGPASRRLEQGMRLERVTRAEAERHQRETDRAWRRYVELIYGEDPADPRWYHLIVDSTVIPLEAVVTIVADAAGAFWRMAS
jgi:cytidylate kinase